MHNCNNIHKLYFLVLHTIYRLIKVVFHIKLNPDFLNVDVEIKRLSKVVGVLKTLVDLKIEKKIVTTC